ncbi:MAG: YtxH domain-containing protein [Rubrobacteraceae bacterium]
MLDKRRLQSFVLGGLTGILAGILLAPRSGRETRGSVMNRAGEARQRGRERYFDARERMRERASSAQESSSPAPGETFSPEPPAETGPASRPVLRDVSREAPEAEDDVETSRSEELRRKVRETRERLRARMDGPAETRGGEDGGEE